MRSDSVTFRLANEAASREPRFVVRIQFDVASPYITSHSDIASVPGDVIQGALQRPSAISQRIIPDQGKSEIGSFDFTLVDLEEQFTESMRSQLTDQLAGLRRRKVEFYVGYRGMAFSSFVLFQTQIVTRCSYKGGVYTVRCSDITRQLKTEVFRPVSTTLRDSISATSTDVPVYNTAPFLMVAHGTSYSDAPSTTVGYVRLEDEVIRYTGQTLDLFIGCTRGALNTKAVAHAVDATTAQDRRTKVEEYIYLEGTGPALALQVMTGAIYGTANTLPDNWHLGIDPAYVRTADFTGIGPDLWVTTDETKGQIFRFEGLGAQDGKAFIETQLYLLLGCYSPVYSDGTMGLKRMVGVISDAARQFTLTEDNIVSLSELEHDYASLHNDFRINWAWDPLQEAYLRTTSFFDAASILAHGAGDLLTYQFRGLQSQRATDSTLNVRLDAIRDRYAEPPQRITANTLGSLNRVEVGDIGGIVVSPAVLRDFAGAPGDYNRSFEVQKKSYDPVSGDVELELFGSTARPGSLPTTNTGSVPLPDAFYSSSGTALGTLITITGGVTANTTITLTGTADLTASGSIFYYLGDLTIAAGTTINLVGNVQLRVEGFVTLNGVINGTGGGKAGVTDPGTGTIDTVVAGTPGYVGNSRGYDGMHLVGSAPRGIAQAAETLSAHVTQGLNAVFPLLSLVVSGSTLQGLPTDLRGTAGGPGGRVVLGAFGITAGGAGAASGAGFCIICRGLAMGAAASVTLNGNSPATTSPVSALARNWYPGSGGAGGPGAFLLLLDGNSLSVPVITGKFFAITGTVTQLGGAMPRPAVNFSDADVFGQGITAGYNDPSVISAQDISNAALRIQYIPETQSTDPDVDPRPPSPTNTRANHVLGGNLITYELPDLDAFDVIEIWSSIDNDRSNSLKAGETRGSSFVEQLALGGLRYYWSRSKINPINFRPPLYSEWDPVSATGGVSSNASNPGQLPSAPANMIATSKVNGIQFQWSLPWAKLLGKIQLWEYTSATPFSAATMVWEGYALGVFLPKSDTTTRYYWLVLADGDEQSVTEPADTGLPAGALSTSGVLYVTAFPVSLTKSGGVPPPNPKAIATASTLATATGGTGPYTYLWTWLAGGTGITIDSPTSATTTFSATNFFDGTTKSGTALITVTDSLSATATYVVAVSMNWPSIA